MPYIPNFPSDDSDDERDRTPGGIIDRIIGGGEDEDRNWPVPTGD